MMKGVVIGGSGNIGKLLCQHLLFDSISRTNGFEIPKDLDKIISYCQKYDIVINCIPDSNQNLLLEKMHEHYSLDNRHIYLITLGSMSYKVNADTHSKNKLMKFSDSLILKKSTVKHTIVNFSWCFNNTANDLMHPISEKEILDVFRFLLAYKDKDSVISMIEVKGKYVL